MINKNYIVIYLSILLIIATPIKAKYDSSSTCSNITKDFTDLFSPFDGFSYRESAITTGIAGVSSALIYKYDTKLVNNLLYSNKDKFTDPGLHTFSSSAYWYGKNKTNLVLTWAGLTGSLLSTGYLTEEDEHIENAVILAESTFFSVFIVGSSKILLGRERPYVEGSNGSFHFLQFNSDNWSLPSGHTTLIFTFASVISHSYDNLFIQIPAYTFAVCSGLERIEHREHWPSDVLLGALLGYYIGSKTYKLNNKRGNTVLDYSLELSHNSINFNFSIPLNRLH